MNLLDVVAILVFVAAVVAGLRTGAIPQLGGILGAIAGLAVALAAGPLLVEVTAAIDPLPRALVVLGVVIAAVAVGEGLGSGIAGALTGGMRGSVLSTVDRTAGAFVGAAQAALLIWLAGGLIAAGPFPTLARIASQSVAVRALSGVLPPPTELVAELAGVLDASRLPDVFLGLDPLPAPPVDRPSDPQAERIAGTAAGSTARVSSLACRTGLTGTAVVVAAGYVVTNAHVVAGATVVRVDAGGSLLDATVVLFDPELDLAVLRVPRLEAPPLRFASRDPVRGDVGAVLGYEGGGALVVLPAGVADAYPATGRDIYGRGRVTRDILELRAAIEPGDSGGPLILEDGSIGGLVFAESRSDADVGYALAPTDVAVAVRPVVGRTTAVPTGPCIR